MTKSRKGLIIIVSAPSGSGKTTLVNKLVGGMEGIKRSVSFTTRAPREDEVRGEDYEFISQEEFRQKEAAGQLLEWEENFGKFYGTSMDQVEDAQRKGEDLVLSIDVKGARKVKERFPESIGIFIMPPSPEVLAERLKNRKTDDAEQIMRRLKESKKEIAASEEYDYMVVNDNLEDAVKELEEIITNERNNLQQQGEEDKDEGNS